MKRIENAEEITRKILSLNVSDNLRVRHMFDGSARIEVDEKLIAVKCNELMMATQEIAELGFQSVHVFPFRSGGIAVNK